MNQCFENPVANQPRNNFQFKIPIQIKFESGPVHISRRVRVANKCSKYENKPVGGSNIMFLVVKDYFETEFWYGDAWRPLFFLNK